MVSSAKWSYHFEYEMYEYQQRWIVVGNINFWLYNSFFFQTGFDMGEDTFIGGTEECFVFEVSIGEETIM